MRKFSQIRKEGAPVFTADDHLWVQAQIEKRAHERWRAGGCREGVAFSDWLQAEDEVLKQFILAFGQPHPLRQASSPKCKTPVADPRQRAKLKMQQRHSASPMNRGRRRLEADSVPSTDNHLTSTARRASAYEYHV